MLDEYRDNPVGFCSLLGFTPWGQQAAILNAVRDHEQVTVRSGNGLGKSAVAAAAALWFLSTHAPAAVLTTAPTHRQVRNVLWREIRRFWRQLRSAHPALPRANLDAIEISEDRFALGLTSDEPDRFQGIRSSNTLVIVDEASGISDDIDEAIQSLLTAQGSRLLLIGNPLRRSGLFYRSHIEEGWKRFHLSALDSPNVRGRRLNRAADRARPPEISGLTTAAWVWQRQQRWGVDSPLYQARVLGEFPDHAADQLLSLQWIEAAAQRGKRRHRRDPDLPVEMGVDVARFGNAETAVCVRQGRRVLHLEAWQGQDLMRTTGHLIRLIRRWKPRLVRVDAIGVGGGVVDRLRELRRDLPGTAIVELNVGKPARDTEQHAILKDELFFSLRDRFRTGDIDIPDDDRLQAQLAALTYQPTSRGQLEILTPEGGKATQLWDRATALMLAFATLTNHLRPRALAGRAR